MEFVAGGLGMLTFSAICLAGLPCQSTLESHRVTRIVSSLVLRPSILERPQPACLYLVYPWY